MTESTRPMLRVWPAVLIVFFQWMARYVVPAFIPEALPVGAMSSLAAALVLILWWLFFSRAPWVDRLGALALMVAALAATQQFLHVSVATAGMGFLFWMYAIPLLSLTFVVWAVVARGWPDGPRRLSMVATILLSCVVWLGLRTDGISGGAQSYFAWRWSETAEERLLADATDELEAPTGAAPGVDVTIEADWPGFRGPARDSIVHGARIETDWSSEPPTELWRRAIGPGWSSFAVGGGLIYTQEQRGDDEVVACYDAATGEPVWFHRDSERFWESNGGAGPRGTPTLRDGRVYAFGATGVLNVLDARDGSLVWSRNVAEDADREVPGWGFSSSPLVLDDAVYVAAADKMVAYDRSSGELRWVGPKGRGGYSSPHVMTLEGAEQVLLANMTAVSAFDPVDGTVLWEHAWTGGVRIVQPARTPDGDLLISGGESTGMRRISVSRASDGWATEEQWTSIRLKPYFNDFVLHEGTVYGFDGRIMAAVDAATGERQWKGGRYGHGQLLLLPEQDLLLVLTEAGELALVAAKSDGFSEIARVPAIEGKTWNHPVLVDDLLLVRNGEEMAAFRLATPST